MAKVTIEDVAAQLAAVNIEASKAQEVIDHLKQIIEEEKAEKANDPLAPKFEFIIVSTSPEFDADRTPLFIAKVEEGSDFTLLPQNICAAARAFNEEQKGKKRRQRKPDVATVGAAFECLKGKQTTAYDFKVVSKGPVISMTMNNELNLGATPFHGDPADPVAAV